MVISPNQPGFTCRLLLRWALCSSSLTFCLASCGQEEPGLPSDIEWRSEHFVYHARAEDPDVCPALLEKMERHFDVLHAAVGLPWPEGRVIHYYKFLDQSDYDAAAGCPEDTSGCAHDGSAYASEPFHEHELIHTYFEPLGSPPRLLSEGVAELLSCGELDFGIAALGASESNAAESTTAELVGSNEMQVLNPERDDPYVLGSILVSHLVKTYGWEAFLDLYGEAWQRRDAGEIDQHLEEIYGISFEATQAAATRGDPLTSCVAAWACAAEPLLPGVAETPSQSCGDSSFRSVTPTEAGVLQLDTDGPGALLLQCPAEAGDLVSGPLGFIDTRVFADLIHGKYFLVSDSDATLTSTRLQDSMFGTDCAALGAFALDSRGAVAHWLVEPRTSPYFLRLELPPGTQLNLTVEGTGPIQICSSCQANDECVSVEHVATFAVRSGAVLHFPAASQPGRLARLSLGVVESQ